jgi:hypothetical protein
MGYGNISSLAEMIEDEDHDYAKESPSRLASSLLKMQI